MSNSVEILCEADCKNSVEGYCTTETILIEEVWHKPYNTDKGSCNDNHYECKTIQDKKERQEEYN